ncbi:hypothetical protein BDY21DRAFT_363506 [Lineolata rhizophorae]|uniref:Uncharacterized protein n=1 Tax=Lineolata rhizophorae TaxID=578093 RepID=A0A6A6P1Y4_9PEZI|nr:hypothetical protein BDY21DRAFT_363506 [Lineolata rhizophorae]
MEIFTGALSTSERVRAYASFLPIAWPEEHATQFLKRSGSPCWKTYERRSLPLQRPFSAAMRQPYNHGSGAEARELRAHGSANGGPLPGLDSVGKLLLLLAAEAMVTGGAAASRMPPPAPGQSMVIAPTGPPTRERRRPGAPANRFAPRFG